MQKINPESRRIALEPPRACCREVVDFAEVAATLRIDIPEELPIAEKAPELIQLIAQHQVVVVCGATGSGKTTQLPKLALAAGLGRKGRIGCTQPRRLAASALSRRVAREMGAETNNSVGYQVRFDNQVSERTLIKFMTDGILLAETRNDRDLRQYECLILDEIHERSLNIDFLLGYLKKLLARRRDLHLILSSATLESERIAEFFNHAPIVEIAGRMFPVEDCYLPPEEDEELPQLVSRGVDFLTELDPRGDILVFLPGEREIRDTFDLLQKRTLRNTELLVLFGRLSQSDQNRIFTTSSKRRVILSTNVAETSLTIPHIRFVIDSGLVRLSRYNPSRRIQELRIENISQASIRQRRGRCGRVEDGVCLHLYSEETAENAEAFTDPEIKRTALAGVILQMAALHLPPPEEFPFLDAPSPALIREGRTELADLGAIRKDGSLTKSGWRLSAMPLDPQLGRMLEKGDEYKVLPEMLVVTAFLSIPDPRERPLEKSQEADAAHRAFADTESDFLGILKLYTACESVYAEKESNSALRRFASKNFLNYRRLREWRNLVEDLRGFCRDNGWRVEKDSDRDLTEVPPEMLHLAILSGIPRHLGCFDSEEKNYYDMNGRRFQIFPGSGLAKRKGFAPWIMSFALVETSRIFARQNAVVRSEYLERIAPHLCKKSYDQIHFSPESGFVSARERLSCGKLLIHPGRRRHYGEINPAGARECLIREALVTGEIGSRVAWLRHYIDQLRHWKEFEVRSRRIGMIVDEASLFEWFDRTLPADATSVKALSKAFEKDHRDYTPALSDAIQHNAEIYLDERLYPDELRLGKERCRLSYKFAPGEAYDGVTCYVKEALLSLFPQWKLDYLVPGYLADKVELLLKSLPKEKRRQLMPLRDTVESFMQDYLRGQLFAEQPLKDLLSSYLEECCEVSVAERDWGHVEWSEALTMKLAILNDEGKISEIYREVPHVFHVGSRISPALPGAAEYCVSGASEWPGTLRGSVLPETVTLARHDNQEVFVALHDEGGEPGTVGVELYLKEGEAHFRHDAGLLRLLRLQLGGILKNIRRDFKFSSALESAFFPGDKERRYREEILDFALKAALGTPEKRWGIRSYLAFGTAREALRMKIARETDDTLALLEQCFESYEAVRKLLRRLPDSSFAVQDVENQLDFLLREGFLRADRALERYPRYFRAIKLRLERALSDPGKDASKGAFLAPYVERFLLLAESKGERLLLSGELYDYFLLLEEARINVYAPEVRSLEKASEKILAQRWAALKL